MRHDVDPWFMTGFDFRCLWETAGLDRLPFPLAYRNRKQRYIAEVEADRQAALVRQRAGMTPNRLRMLDALRFPMLVMTGFGRIEDGAGQRIFRLFGAIGTAGYCAVVTQDPSDELIFGEDIQIIGCANVDFPQVILEALPDYKPGARSRKDGQYEDETPAQVLRESRISGSILLSGSSEFSQQYELRNENHLTLINVADDGAYVVNEGVSSFQIIPATIPNLLAAFKKIEKAQVTQLEERLTAARSDREFNGIP
ncbi:ESX secretion-associated protein EspG [Mycobacterium sp. NPDC003449]